MKLRNLWLCIHYKKSIKLSGITHDIQPGDTEISYLGGLKRYVFIGFNEGIFDDYGELCFATDDVNEAKKFIIDNKLILDKKLVAYSELLDYHENYFNDTVGQWKMISLAGNFIKNSK